MVIYFFDLNEPNQAILIFGVFILVGLIGHLLTSPQMEARDPRSLVVYTLLAIVTRFIIYALLALVVILFEKEDIIENLILFFALYVPYTAFEIYANYLRQKRLQST